MAAHRRPRVLFVSVLVLLVVTCACSSCVALSLQELVNSDNVQAGQVKSTVSYHGASLTGTIPTVLATLDKVQTMRLGGNVLTKTIPTALARLTTLTWLRLDKNQLTGSLPVEFSALTLIQRLELDNNKFVGPLPASWSTLVGCTTLHLFVNELSGSLPTEWSTLTGLFIMDVRINKLSSSLPAQWSQLTGVRNMHVYENKLSGSLPAAWGLGMKSLQSLTANWNKLQGGIPVQWAVGLTSLTLLYLSENPHMRGPLPDVSRLRNLLLARFPADMCRRNDGSSDLAISKTGRPVADFAWCSPVASEGETLGSGAITGIAVGAVVLVAAAVALVKRRQADRGRAAADRRQPDTHGGYVNPETIKMVPVAAAGKRGSDSDPPLPQGFGEHDGDD